MPRLSRFLLLPCLLGRFTSGDVVFEHELIKPEEIFDFVYSTDSDVWWETNNNTKYYCIFRNLWDKEHHPKSYPTMARWSDPLIYSATKQFVPWLKNRATTWGVEKLAESGFTDTLKNEITVAGALIRDYQQGKGWFIDQEDWDKNYAYLPGVTFDRDHPFLAGMASIKPSPDWFTGFYLFDTIDEFDRTFWDHFIVRTYPWDAGTDAATTFTAPDEDLDPPEVVSRITEKNAPNGLFVSPEGKVLPVAEWDCILHVCDIGHDDCEPENWPPENGCDRLRYPGCELQCDPTAEPCQECKPKVNDPRQVYYHSCCESGYEPKDDYTCVTRPTIAGGHEGAVVKKGKGGGGRGGGSITPVRGGGGGGHREESDAAALAVAAGLVMVLVVSTIRFM